ncbi:MAG TPA: vWA domain-containing protein [Kofleriaceae bacterium]|nr:vWA domain-containing protein [Kofleriaceae bacterium]
MNHVRILLVGFTIVLATIIAGSSTAHAQRKMLVLIDASGSMSTPRVGDAVHPTRFDAAKALAEQRILEQDNVSVLSGVAVYTFSDSTATLRTPVSAAHPTGFVSVNEALDAIDALDLFTAGGGSTPLAGSMCDAIDTLVAEAGTFRILQVSSDGLENSTPIGHQCQGPDTVDPEPFTSGSWQNLVLAKFNGSGVQARVDLFDSTQISLAARLTGFQDPESQITAQARTILLTAAAAIGVNPPTLEEFFAAIARVTGGQLTLVEDELPIPVYADMNDDRCVDRTDSNLMARRFGQTVPPADVKFDLSLDGKIGFADYSILLANRTGCGQPDPFTPRAPVLCTSGKVVIENQSIEDAGLTVDVEGFCQIVIKNSVIVSGKNAINVVGTAVVTVDNSTLVGENAVVSSFGVTLISAANTVFHGNKAVIGALAIIDRGGNTFE